MADFAPALDYVLNFEDSQRSYASNPDCGGFAIAGINSKSWPTEYANIDATPQAQRAPAVAAFYESNFWTPLNIGSVASQDVANRVLDMSVNAGPRTGTRLLQQAANTLGCTLTVDGVLGPASLAAINAIDPTALLSAYRAARVAHYQAIVADTPSSQKYLAVWLQRAQA